MFDRIFTRNTVLLLNEAASPKQVCGKTHQETLDKCDETFSKIILKENEDQLAIAQSNENEAWSQKKYRSRLAKLQNGPEAKERLAELRRDDPVYQEALTEAKSSKFNVYLEKEAVKGSTMHQEVRHHAKILFAVGVLLAAATTALVLTHLVTLSTTAWVCIPAAVIFLVLFGLGTLLVSHYKMRGKEVIAIKYSDLHKLYEPARGSEKAFVNMREDKTCYIHKKDYKSFQKALYKANHPTKK